MRHRLTSKDVLVRADGYRLVWKPDHPSAHKGYVYEHRLVVEQWIGRPLERNEVVHHENGDPSDNRPENLRVVTKAWHQRHHLGGPRSDEEIRELLLAGVRGAEIKRLVPSTHRLVRLRRELREEGLL